MNDLYNAYKTREDVRFYIIYTKEPHPRQPLGSKYNFSSIEQPKSYKQRVGYAKSCKRGKRIALPILVDTMDGKVQKAYGGLPNSVVVIDPAGKIAARKAWNDPLFVELSLRTLVKDPPRVKHTGVMGNCEKCHEEAAAKISKEHPITDCSICHSWFFKDSIFSDPDANARKHEKRPKGRIGKKMNCTVKCHNPEFLPKERDIGYLPFSHQRHLDRGARCINCHGNNKHAFHEMSGKICVNCHVETDSVVVKPGVLRKLKKYK